MKILPAISLMRPHQYIKNLFIFLPIFFTQKITDIDLLLSTIIAFIAFSLTASAIYAMNDYYDLEQDKQHPKKKNRPLASGSISKKQTIVIISILLFVGMGIMLLLSTQAAIILVVYVVMNIAYSGYFKHIAIIDVTIIALGFVLRLFVGAAVTDVPLSNWIVIMTFLLALFMALAKRRDDILIYLDMGKEVRRVMDGYNLRFLDTAMTIAASVVIVAYAIYSISVVGTAKHGQYLYLTVIFVILGIMRYLQIIFVYKDSGSPTRIIIKDHFIKVTIAAWILSFVWIVYL